MRTGDSSLDVSSNVLIIEPSTVSPPFLSPSKNSSQMKTHEHRSRTVETEPSASGPPGHLTALCPRGRFGHDPRACGILGVEGT